MAAVFLTVGRVASAAEMALYQTLMQQFGSQSATGLLDLGIDRPSCYYATHGRSHMNTLLGKRK
jgi:hypothetical protein